MIGYGFLRMLAEQERQHQIAEDDKARRLLGMPPPSRWRWATPPCPECGEHPGTCGHDEGPRPTS